MRLIRCRVALIVQIHLQQNRTDLALKEVQAAKRWAQDSLLVNLAESWVGMRVVRSSLLSGCVRLRIGSNHNLLRTGRRTIPIRFLRLRRTCIRP